MFQPYIEILMKMEFNQNPIDRNENLILLSYNYILEYQNLESNYVCYQ